mmetsp:Transcript_9929/g.60627  ORF Transcript_9929/g.60627 Transcript_9929/m.60627 type:complete len:201 (+) Transcript_9929:1147-1749(+)
MGGRPNASTFSRFRPHVGHAGGILGGGASPHPTSVFGMNKSQRMDLLSLVCFGVSVPSPLDWSMARGRSVGSVRLDVSSFLDGNFVPDWLRWRRSFRPWRHVVLLLAAAHLHHADACVRHVKDPWRPLRRACPGALLHVGWRTFPVVGTSFVAARGRAWRQWRFASRPFRRPVLISNLRRTWAWRSLRWCRCRRSVAIAK